MSNSKNIKTKTGALAIAGVVLAAALLATFAFAPTNALAQEIRSDENGRHRLVDRPYVTDERPAHRLGFNEAIGSGIATDAETGDEFRTGFKTVVQKLNDSDNDYGIKRGVLAISVDGERIRYQMLTETWKTKVSEDGFTFEASGLVQTAKEEKLNLVLNGYFAMHSRLGNLWSIEGTMTGEDTKYDLHYVAITHELRTYAAVDERAIQ